MPVGVETKLVEMTEGEEGGKGESTLGEGEEFEEIRNDSPMLWFSGLIDLSTPLPTHTSSSSMPTLMRRRARLSLRTCVTSVDGSSQVVHTPPSVVVGSYQEAERFGEMCARAVREAGGGDILDEVARVRRERERRDLERAIEKSRADGAAGGEGGGKGGKEERDRDGDHRGLDGLMSSLTATSI